MVVSFGVYPQMDDISPHLVLIASHFADCHILPPVSVTRTDQRRRDLAALIRLGRLTAAWVMEFVLSMFERTQSLLDGPHECAARTFRLVGIELPPHCAAQTHLIDVRRLLQGDRLRVVRYQQAFLPMNTSDQ